MLTATKNGRQVSLETVVCVLLVLVSAAALYVCITTNQTRLVPFLVIAFCLASFMALRRAFRRWHRADNSKGSLVTK